MPWLVFGLYCGWATGRLTEGSGGDRKFVKRGVRSADIGNCSDRDAAITTHLTHSVRAFNSLPHSVRFILSQHSHLLLASLAHKEVTRDGLVAYLFERSNNLISIWGPILTLNTFMKHFISDTYHECDVSSNGRWLEYCRFITYTNLLGSVIPTSKNKETVFVDIFSLLPPTKLFIVVVQTAQFLHFLSPRRDMFLILSC